MAYGGPILANENIDPSHPDSITSTESGTKRALDVNIVDPVVVPSTWSFNGGRKIVTVAGTREALVATSTLFKEVTIQALVLNTGNLVVGGSDVVETEATRNGAWLAATQSIHIVGPGDLNDIFLDVSVDAEGVSFVYST